MVKSGILIHQCTVKYLRIKPDVFVPMEFANTWDERENVEIPVSMDTKKTSSHLRRYLVLLKSSFEFWFYIYLCLILYHNLIILIFSKHPSTFTNPKGFYAQCFFLKLNSSKTDIFLTVGLLNWSFVRMNLFGGYYWIHKKLTCKKLQRKNLTKISTAD